MGSLSLLNVLHTVPHLPFADDEKLQKDGLFGLFKVSQQLRVHRFAAGKILRAGVLPCGIRAVAFQIAALPQRAGVQRGGVVRLRGKVFFVGVVHSLHLQAQAFGRALVAEGQIQRPAQQRQEADQRDPAHLVGAVLVLADKVQDDERTQGVEQAVEPHPPRRERPERPRQPDDLQCHQHHRDRDPVDDAVEEFDDRRTKKHGAASLVQLLLI